MKDVELEKNADYLSKLTFNMQKICNEKEAFFCKRIDITPMEFRCLRYLLKNDLLSVKKLAELMELTPPRVTKLLNSLEDKNYIKRKIGEKDRRNIQVALTKSGEDFAIKIKKEYIKYHKDILSLCESKEVEAMIKSLEKFGNVLEKFLINSKEFVSE